jgi:hypothetical protein
MTNHLESFNHQIKHKYFTPYYHSGRLPRIDAWVYTLVVKVLPAFFVQREERTTKVDYYLGMRRTIYHGNYSASDESDISIPVVDPPMAEVDKIDDVDCTLMISEMVNEATSEALELLEDCNDDVEVMPLILSSDSNSCSLIINAENLGADRMEIDDPELCFNGWDELVLDTDDILCNINDLDLPQTLLSCSDHPCLLPPSPERSHKINTGPITPITPIHILDTTHSIPHINPQMDDDDGLYDSKSFDDLHTEAEAIYMQKMLTAEDTLVQSLQKLMSVTLTPKAYDTHLSQHIRERLSGNYNPSPIVIHSFIVKKENMPPLEIPNKITAITTTFKKSSIQSFVPQTKEKENRHMTSNNSFHFTHLLRCSQSFVCTRCFHFCCFHGISYIVDPEIFCTEIEVWKRDDCISSS